MDSQNAAYHPRLKPAVVVTGTANEGTAGPAIGHVDIGVSDAAYLFRVALPGLRRKYSKIPLVLIFHYICTSLILWWCISTIIALGHCFKCLPNRLKIVMSIDQLDNSWSNR